MSLLHLMLSEHAPPGTGADSQGVPAHSPPSLGHCSSTRIPSPAARPCKLLYIIYNILMIYFIYYRYQL